MKKGGLKKKKKKSFMWEAGGSRQKMGKVSWNLRPARGKQAPRKGEDHREKERKREELKEKRCREDEEIKLGKMEAKNDSIPP